MFVLMTAPNGKRMLLNLDLVVVFQEGEKGETVALTLGGLPVTMGEQFNFVMNEMLGEEPAPAPQNTGRAAR